jgi:cytoskeletal protein CcmA (bactofilin family)
LYLFFHVDPFKYLPSASDTPETTLGDGIVFKGELAFKRYLCINGEFEGVLKSNGKLRVGKTGWVKSNLHLKSAIVEGRVEGDICVEDLLELRGSACVRGNIVARYLRVDDGVTLVGHVNICPEGQVSSNHNGVFESQD